MRSGIDEIAIGLKSLCAGVEHLNLAFPHRKFTLDGRLVGDIGEIVAVLNFDIILDATPTSLYRSSRPEYDATTRCGSHNIQIKATFQDALTFKNPNGLFLGIKLFHDGRHEVVYNGPAVHIFDEFQHRRGIGVKLLRFPNWKLRAIEERYPERLTIPRIIASPPPSPQP
ncbi:DUF6998 domain-containing protein [Parerythrobacter lacustris]|uniref:DUF6998 domain-containing protein n=1 Tax=Parerythrobacter lacustris TaxID=2969984 RepID=A0ABT1XTT4_9SPHN|nr:hypothetical protein [Parerythrobacter lacustris]MCR2834075.1 hypothetical protein [Parerythrobacter lacustris]